MNLRENLLLKKRKQTKPWLFLVTSPGHKVTAFAWGFEDVKATSANMDNLPGRGQPLLLFEVFKGLEPDQLSSVLLAPFGIPSLETF